MHEAHDRPTSRVIGSAQEPEKSAVTNIGATDYGDRTLRPVRTEGPIRHRRSTCEVGRHRVAARTQRRGRSAFEASNGSGDLEG